MIPGSGRSPGKGNSYSLQYSCLENPMNRGAWSTTIPLNIQVQAYFFLFSSFSLSFFLDMLCSLWNPQPGTEPGPWTVKAQSADCWTDREVPKDVSVFLHFALLYFTATAFFFFLTNCRWHPCIQQVYVPTAFAHFMSLCHTVMILTIF